MEISREIRIIEIQSKTQYGNSNRFTDIQHEMLKLTTDK